MAHRCLISVINYILLSVFLFDELIVKMGMFWVK
jgi:hypothetical protein